MRGGRRGRWALAVLLVVALMTAACASGDDDGVEAAPTTAVDPVPSSPRAGGRLVVGLEAETDGFDPTQNRWAVSGFEVAKAIFEPLMAPDADGTIQPYLAESLTRDATATEWTLRVRPGITFHDGTPLDAAAVKTNLDRSMTSLTNTGALVFGPVEGVDVVDPLTVRIVLSEPWYPFPAALAGQWGYLASPAQLADPETSPRNPIGTGPFVFERWQRDSELVVRRNEEYWRPGLPYLDEIVFKPLPDEGARYGGLVSGALDLIITANVTAIEELRDDPDYRVVEYSGNEAITVIFNTAKPPFDDVRVRRALALAVDRQLVNAVSGGGVRADADGPIAPSSPWYEPTGYPDFDPDAARRLLDAYEAEVGAGVSFTLNMPAAPQTMEFGQLLQAQWTEVGADVRLAPVDQQTLITEVVTQRFEASGWRNFEFLDPDAMYPYWHSEGVNFTRLVDDEVDAALRAGRSTADPGERRMAYARFTRRLAELLPAVWVGHNVWGIIVSTDVHDVTDWTLPDGQPGMPVYAGNVELAQIWRG